MGRVTSACLATCLVVGPSLGCSREPIEEVCPEVEVGGLVIAELRGAQDGQDSFGHYIGIYNASGSSLDLRGVVLRQRSAGGDELAVTVRSSVEVAAGGYATVGPGLLEALPIWLDYGIGFDISGGDPQTGEFPRDLLRYGSAFIDLEVCGVVVDDVFWTDGQLPRAGSLACGNAERPPSAAGNDFPGPDSCWCVDANEADPAQPLPGLGLPGTPGRSNRCP